MARTYLQTNTVNHNHQIGSYENIERELLKEEKHLNEQLRRIRAELLNTDADDELLNTEQTLYRQALDTTAQDMELLKKYPESFPYLYSVREHAKADDMQGTFREVLSDESEIVTESGDVMPREETLELNYEIDGVPFAVSAEPYDKPGEDETQLKGRINFSNKALEDLNEERLKQILEFCEQHGMSVYDIEIPMKDGKVDLDEKLASLTQKVLEARRAQDAANPGADVEDDDIARYQEITPEIKGVDLSIAKGKGGKAKAPKTLDSVRADILEMIEKDMKKTRGLTFFERSRSVDGLSTTVYSIYDKPDKDNEKKDGVKDKNGIYVPTYTYRLYIAQNPQTGRFVFGYSTPGGKKMDDTMAGDFIAIVKKNGATHVNFSQLSSADKGVWMMACAEKGLVPIGISLNLAKAKAMVEAARKKLSNEEFVLFKKRLAEQMLENAEKKNPGKEHSGLPKSEYDYIQTMRSGYDFENFRSAYDAEGGLYTTVLSRIEEGGANAEKGAAITFGAMRTLRSVFDLYIKNQNGTFGEALAKTAGSRYPLTKEEIAALSIIPAGKPMMDLNTDDFMAIYRVLEPRQVKLAEEDILAAYRRELKRKPQRADTIVLTSDLFPKVKSEVNGINIYLGREGIDTLTLPNEHSGLSFARPAELTQQPTNQNAPAQQNTNAVVNAQVQNSGNVR